MLGRKSPSVEGNRVNSRLLRWVTTLRSGRILILALTALMGLVATGLTFLPSGFSFFNMLERPRLEVSTTRLDLGDGKPNQVMSGKIRLKNIGHTPLDFTITTSCGCQEASPRNGTIAPGEEVPLSLSVRLPDYSGAEKSVQVIVHSNDPERPEASCAIVARAPAPFEVTPGFIDFGRVDRNELASLSANVKVTLREGESRALQARLKGTAFLASSNKVNEVQIKPHEAREFGDHYDTLELYLEGAEEELIRVPLHMLILAPLATVPSTLILRKDQTGQFHPLEWILVSNDKSLPLGKLTMIDAPAEFHIEEIDRIDDYRHRFRLTIGEQWSPPRRFVLELQNSSTAHRCKLQFVSLPW